MSKYSFCLLLMIPVFFSCQKDKLTPDAAISDAELKILQDCRAAQLGTAEAIRENLIGIWELEGYACGYCAYDRVQMPEASIAFSKSEGFFDYQYDNDNTSYPFEWVVTQIATTPNFVLETTPEDRKLMFTCFCKDYTILDQRAGDGPLYIYKKK